MHPLQTLVANKVIFAAIVLTALLLYLAVASLLWHRDRRHTVSTIVPPARRPVRSTDDDPAAIAGEISANLEKLLAEKSSGSIDKDILLKKLLRSERFKG
ncbi:MAG TPA: hypothetical protein VN616_18445 [Puia sp.]|nr:hypothetical protein [Puia sp.]